MPKSGRVHYVVKEQAHLDNYFYSVHTNIVGDFNSRSLVAAIVLLFVGTAVGYSLGKYSVPPQAPTSQGVQTKNLTPTSPLFRSQTATFQGEVTKVSGNKLSVKDEKGQTGDFPVSNKVVIYKFKEGSSQASASSDLNLIETNKKALMVLELMNGKYQVTSISYLPPPPKK